MGRVRLLFINYYFYTCFLLFSVIVIPSLTLLVGLASLFVSRRSSMRRFRRAISWYGRGMTAVPFPAIRLLYEDHSGGGHSAASIFVCNHRAASDAFLMCVLPHEAVQVVNTWPFRIPVIGVYAKMAGYLNVNNMEPEAFHERAAGLLHEGVSIIFFPEGTRSGKKELGPFHGTAFRLAMRSRAPIVPLCISGNEKIPPRGSLLLHPGTIRVRRLPAIPWEDYREFSVFSLKNRVREIIAAELSVMECRI
jgi:1-acyl-sn-glycerol-3-phosphate acyltransferase